MEYVLLSDYIDREGTLRAGTVLDERQHDIAALREAGAALVEKLPAFDKPITDFLTQRRRLPSVDFGSIATALKLPGAAGLMGSVAAELGPFSNDDYYESQSVLEVLGSGSVFTSVILIRPRGLSTLTADSLANSGTVLGDGILWSAIASTPGMEDEWPFAFVFNTDAGVQLATPPTAPGSSGMIGRVAALGVRVDLGQNLAQHWFNGGALGDFATTGANFITDSQLFRLGRDSDEPPPPTAPNPAVRTGILGFCSTKRFLSVEEISMVQGAMIAEMDVSSEGLTGGDWEFKYSVKQSTGAFEAARVLPNQGTVGAAGDLVRVGNPPVRFGAAHPSSPGRV